MAEEWDGETTFSPTNSSKEHLSVEQTAQNNFWSLAEDIRRPEKQPIVFERREKKSSSTHQNAPMQASLTRKPWQANRPTPPPGRNLHNKKETQTTRI